MALVVIEQCPVCGRTTEFTESEVVRAFDRDVILMKCPECGMIGVWRSDDLECE